MDLREPIGRVVGETTHSKVVFTANRPPRVGEYVIVSYPPTLIDGVESSHVLAMIESTTIGNPLLLLRSIKPEYVERASRFNLERTEYILGVARLLGWIEPLVEKGRLLTPKYPPKPGAPVYSAEDKVLQKVFTRSTSEGWVRIGTLVNHSNVPVYVNVNAIVSRHLAILAVTGAGKSNTVGVLVDRIVNDLNGTVFIVDMHNEYGKIAGDKTYDALPKIHPAKLTIYEYYRLLDLEPSASKQRMYLRKAYRELFQSGEAQKEAEKFLEKLVEKLKEYMEGKYKKDSRPLSDLINKLEELRERYEGKVLVTDAPMTLEDMIKPGMANVLKLGSVDEEVADVLVYHYLSWLLRERKNKVISGEGYPVPVLVVIEEAHVLIPRKRNTLTKEIAARIAREGRKFGVGLCLVSQRPKNIDEDALSQTNNKIILKLVEPSDQKYVQQASETLSEELLELLSSLNVGEAILLGLMTPLPALVKIDKARQKIGGGDIEVHREWLNWRNKPKEGPDYDPYMLMD